jgi:SAM-dependent methyltransferase
VVAPPGTILQHLYLRERLRNVRPGSFVEVGVGIGLVSKLLLDLGWHGIAYDVGNEAVERALSLNAAALEAGRYGVEKADWLTLNSGEPVDLVISSMVIEHLPDDEEERYFARCREGLSPGGKAVVIVPASPAHWGIEDEIAGHVRRYTREGLRCRLGGLGWEVRHLAGLTYPVSNLLLPISNALVARAEKDNQGLSVRERTRRSGVRSVRFKTTFPNVLGPVLNEWTMYPFHLLQKTCQNREGALVLYAEATPTA